MEGSEDGSRLCTRRAAHCAAALCHLCRLMAADFDLRPRVRPTQLSYCQTPLLLDPTPPLLR